MFRDLDSGAVRQTEVFEKLAKPRREETISDRGSEECLDNRCFDVCQPGCCHLPQPVAQQRCAPPSVRGVTNPGVVCQRLSDIRVDGFKRVLDLPGVP